MTETTSTVTLVCPKCHGPMRAYERNGVTIDQCTDCRGIYLDRGEHERLIDAEATHYRAAPQPEYGYRDHDDDDEREHRDWKHGRQPRKRRSFLEGMFGD